MQAQQATPPDAVQRLQQIEGFLAIDPDNKHLLGQAIDLALQAGALDSAEQHAVRACARYPDDPFFAYRRAHVLMARMQWEPAQAIFAQLLTSHPNINIAQGLAQCQVQQGQFEQACASLAPFRADPAFSVDAATALVRSLHHLRQFDAAGQLIAEQQARGVADPVFLGAASLACLDGGMIDQAQALSDAALAGPARPVEALVTSATLALGHTDTATAIARYQEVLDKKPQEGRSWSGLGMANLLLRDMNTAIAQLEQAVKFMPDHIGTWHALGWARLFAQDMPGAAQAFDSALVLDRNFGESHGAVAVLAALKGERDAAEGAIARALRLDPQSLSARYAQMVLGGQTADPERFKAIAYRFMSSHKTMSGESLADVVKRHSGG